MSSEKLRINLLPGKRKTLFVAFTGILHGIMGDRPGEFIKSTNNNGEFTSIYISDLSTSWYNDEVIHESIVRTIRDIQSKYEIEETILLGNSMGGYGALLFSSEVNASLVISIVPQFSVDPSIIPFDKRWSVYQQKISKYRSGNLNDHISSRCRYFVLGAGEDPIDMQHISMIKNGINITTFIVKAKHDLAAKLKNSGSLRSFFDMCRKNNPNAALMLLQTVYGHAEIMPSDTARAPASFSNSITD
ncbi:hypothetical protein [Breoghania sp.]|uniref:hypothetical protein n=1 Tax=Breoghania sp. TaxID=2065378 RepID=UPI002AAC0623|nr:hypothetical protein [Breoghania sp.]